MGIFLNSISLLQIIASLNLIKWIRIIQFYSFYQLSKWLIKKEKDIARNEQINNNIILNTIFFSIKFNEINYSHEKPDNWKQLETWFNSIDFISKCKLNKLLRITKQKVKEYFVILDNSNFLLKEKDIDQPSNKIIICNNELPEKNTFIIGQDIRLFPSLYSNKFFQKYIEIPDLEKNDDLLVKEFKLRNLNNIVKKIQTPEMNNELIIDFKFSNHKSQSFCECDLGIIAMHFKNKKLCKIDILKKENCLWWCNKQSMEEHLNFIVKVLNNLKYLFHIENINKFIPLNNYIKNYEINCKLDNFQIMHNKFITKIKEYLNE